MAALLVLGAFQGAPEVGLAELEAEPSSYDGEIVRVTGEIVGDYGVRERFVWIQINDDAYSVTPLEEGTLRGTNRGVGVRLDRTAFDPTWGDPGGYRQRGPLVTVTGVFRYNDPESGGETFIEARRVDLIEPSRPIEAAQRSPAPAITGAVFALAAAALFSMARRRRPTG